MNAEHRRKVADQLDIPLAAIPSVNSMAYDEILAAAEAGTIKALWIVATNPFHSWINSGRLAALREKLEFLVVQDMYHSTESALAADLFLPAAGWGEKEGCFINSERRVGTIKAVRRAPGQALSDFRIFRLIANAWGCGEMFAKWTSPEAVFTILRDLTKDRPCDITGIEGYELIDRLGGIQWPYPEGIGDDEKQAENLQSRRLFEDGIYFTADRQAKILFSPPVPMPEPPDAEFPFLLLTGRGTSSQWHTQSRTAKSDILRKLYPHEIYLEIHPLDASEYGLGKGDKVLVRSRRGELIAAVYLAPTVQQGHIFIPMHYREVNRLTHSAFDPHSRQPNYKACAVALVKAGR